MSLFPDILPADPSAPEEVFHRRKRLKYGFMGRLVLALDIARERRQLARLDDLTLRDIGLSRDAPSANQSRWNAPSKRGSQPNWRAELDRCLSQPGVL